jgi:hypothetical protein
LVFRAALIRKSLKESHRAIGTQTDVIKQSVSTNEAITTGMNENITDE